MNYRTKLLLSFIGLAIAGSTLLYFLVNHLAEQSLFRQIQQTVRTIAIATAQEIDGNRHDEIRDETGDDSEAYRAARLQLRSIRDAHRRENTPIAFIYTFRPSEVDPGKWIYVVDSEEDGSDHSAYGDRFDFQAEDARDLVFSLDDPARADHSFTSDQYGIYLSAHAPVYDDQGKIVARVGVDVNASDVHDVQKKLREGTLIALLATSVLGIALSLILSYRANQPLKQITDALERIGAGDLDTRLNSERGDEFGLVERAVDSMAASLQENLALQGSLTRYVARDLTSDVAAGSGDFGTPSGSTSKRITVLFCDIEELDQDSQNPSQEKILEDLNAFFADSIGTIFENGGTLDRFFGAGLMATFGAIRKGAPHETLALTTAIKMHEAFAEAIGDDPISLRIGIHTAEASLADPTGRGVMGYEAIGEAVNGAARIAATGRERDIDILVSEETLSAAGEAFQTKRVGVIDDESPSITLFQVIVS